MATQSEPGDGGATAPVGGSGLMAEPPPAYQAVDEQKSAEGPPTGSPQATTTQPPYASPPGTQPPYGQFYAQPGYPGYAQQPVQYVVSAPYPSAFPKPNFPGPHHFLVYVIIVAAFCGLLMPLSLAFSIPALVCVSMGMHQQSLGQYPAASRLSTAAIVLTNLTIVSTLLMWVILVGVIVGLSRATCSRIYYNRFDGFGSSCY